MNDIKGVTRYTFTYVATGEVTSGIFMFEDEDGIFIRTDDCTEDGIGGANFGVHPMGIAFGDWTYTRTNAPKQ